MSTNPYGIVHYCMERLPSNGVDCKRRGIHFGLWVSCFICRRRIRGILCKCVEYLPDFRSEIKRNLHYISLEPSGEEIGNCSKGCCPLCFQRRNHLFLAGWG